MVYIVDLYRSSDPSWDTFGISIWSGIELAVAIIAASIPAIKPIVDRMFPKLFPSSFASQSASHRVYPSGSRIQSTRHYQPRDLPQSLFARRGESDIGDDDSTKAIAHNWPNQKSWREHIILLCIEYIWTSFQFRWLTVLGNPLLSPGLSHEPRKSNYSHSDPSCTTLGLLKKAQRSIGPEDFTLFISVMYSKPGIKSSIRLDMAFIQQSGLSETYSHSEWTFL